MKWFSKESSLAILYFEIMIWIWFYHLFVLYYLILWDSNQVKFRRSITWIKCFDLLITSCVAQYIQVSILKRKAISGKIDS